MITRTGADIKKVEKNANASTVITLIIISDTNYIDDIDDIDDIVIPELVIGYKLIISPRFSKNIKSIIINTVNNQ